MILVIGGRSRTGRELIGLLRGAGMPLRVLTRPGETAEDPDAVRGDLAKPGTLDAAMAGAEKVFLLCSAAHDELAWNRNAIDAAARAGVRHLVRSSILGADPASPARFIRHHGQADEHLRESGVGYTILRPNMYMHNVSALWPATLGPDGAYYAPAGDARISMTDARDIAAVAYRTLLDDGHAGKAYDVTGPEALSHANACDKLAAVLGRPVRYVPVDDETARSAMAAAGLNRWMNDPSSSSIRTTGAPAPADTPPKSTAPSRPSPAARRAPSTRPSPTPSNRLPNQRRDDREVSHRRRARASCWLRELLVRR